MTIVTLTTDWQNDDFYGGAIKGLLYSQCENVQVVDITHKIENYKYTQAAFVLRNAFVHFPIGTIHIIGINSYPTQEHPPVCVKIKGHYFLGTASGIFSLMFTEAPELIIKITETEELVKSSFSELSLFAKAAALIANGTDVNELGEKLEGKYRHVQFRPAIDENDISGSVIYIDSYSNVITNISKELFEQVGKGRSFTLSIKSDSYSISKLSKGYHEVEVGEMLALFNSLNLIEIAMRNAQLTDLLDIRINSPVTIKFR